MKTSVIISTCNEPDWLEKVLWGYETQTFQNFDLIIADDGSEDATRMVINRFKNSSALKINHVWHPRNGYQKCRILNKAIEASCADYLIFSDGDCVPRNDFVSCHLKNAMDGFFLSGGIIRLPMTTSKLIGKNDIFSQQCFDLNWLLKAGLKRNFLKNLKLTPNKKVSNFLNRITPANASWNGHNSSGWKKDILLVNGMNEQMEYGGQDRELGERLINKGILGKQIRYSTVCLHLDHARGYKTPESIEKNRKIRERTRKDRLTWTPHGIRKGNVVSFVESPTLGK